LVPHTHWDREWYLPFEQFRIQLGRVMDDLLETLEENPSLVFTLDGQTVILEDYLDLRPQQEERLRRTIASGRIAIGPSYVLPDEFLAGQESLVRNLLMGRQLCDRFGVAPMAVGYAPDTFGHIAQMPQILSGFGIDSFVFWRGLGDEADDLGALFWWQAPDGSRVLGVRLLEGYASARDLGRWTREGGWVLDDPGRWPGTAARRIAEFVRRWRPALDRSGTRNLLLGNGVDHQPIQRDLPEMLGACQLCFPEASFHIGTYQDYVEALRPFPTDLQRLEGELVGGREACVVRGVNSTRIYLKQANEAAERSLAIAETLAALAWLRASVAIALATRGHPGSGQDVPGATKETGACNRAVGFEFGRATSLPGAEAAYQYPLDELRLAWRELLRNQPHDSLPGCSLDEVHRDMEQRFRSAKQIAQLVQREALTALAEQAPSMRPREDNMEAWSLVNPLPWRRIGLSELELPVSLARTRRLLATTPKGNIPVQVAGPHDRRTALVAAEVDGFGALPVRLMAGQASLSQRVARAVGTHGIENEYYHIEVAPNGTLEVMDQKTGHRLVGLHWFEDEADRGDEYSYCPVDGDVPWDSRSLRARTRLVAGGPVVAELEIRLDVRLPRKLRRDRKGRSRSTAGCPLRTRVRLIAGVDRIEFSTTALNRAQDHRFRVIFPAPGSGRHVLAEGHFGILRRPAEPVWNGCWREPPAKTHHTAGAVAAGELLLIGRGLPEYEAIPNDRGGVDLALTLLRCVGWLSCSDLSTRPGAQEPHIPTPDAQCLGSHTFEYAISLRGDGSEAELLRASQDYRMGFVAGPSGEELPEILALEGDGFVFGALKGAEDGQGVVLRLFNPGSSPTIARIRGMALEAHRCRLDEGCVESGGVEKVALRAGEIVTLRIVTCPSPCPSP